MGLFLCRVSGEGLVKTDIVELHISEWGGFYAQGLGKAWVKTDIVEFLVSGVVFMHRVWERLGLRLILWSY